MMFPLGKTGGLIEAIRNLGNHGSAFATFPLGKTGGLIEAVKKKEFYFLIKKFPLGKTGGLIEATRAP